MRGFLYGLMLRTGVLFYHCCRIRRSLMWTLLQDALVLFLFYFALRRYRFVREHIIGGSSRPKPPYLAWLLAALGVLGLFVDPVLLGTRRFQLLMFCLPWIGGVVGYLTIRAEGLTFDW